MKFAHNEMKDSTVHIILLLDKRFRFPHNLNHFPLSASLKLWLSKNPQYRATIITPTPIVYSAGIADQIDIDYIRCSPNIFSALKYRLSISVKLFAIQLKGIIDKKNNSRFIILKLDKSLCIDLIKKDIPDSVFIPLEETKKEFVKSKFSNEYEYFICTANFHDIKSLIFLLKAFSLIKKRLRSGIKLMLTGIHPQTHASLFKQIRQYKYQSDLIVLNDEVAGDYATLLGAAYAQIFPSHDLLYPTGKWEAVSMGVPVILSDHYAEQEEDAGNFLYFKKDSVEDLAEKMMLLYKDEAMRKKMIHESSKALQLRFAENKNMDRFLAILKHKGL